MKKKLSLLIVITVIFALCSCGKTNSTKKIEDIDGLALKLSQELEFDDEIELSDDEFTLSKYGIDTSKINDVARYAGSGATADEIAVFKCADSDCVEEVQNAVKSRIEYLYDGYSDYDPAEVPKINSSVILINGDVIVFVICKNADKAEEIVNGFLV